MPLSRPILETLQPCQKALEDNLHVPPLMEYEWAQNRLADFNLWCAGLGALAKGRVSLDHRLQEKIFNSGGHSQPAQHAPNVFAGLPTDG